MPEGPGSDNRLEAYLGERRRLVRLAYRYLGSVSEAEDAVQDAWLRFSAAASVEDPPRFLSRIITNLCLDRLKSAARRRETYVGPWLPEPIVEAVGAVEPETGDSALDVSYAVMRALERLSPLERAALFLHDLCDMPFAEIGQTLHRSEAACRQLAARARRAVRAETPRFKPNESDVSRFLAGLAETMSTGDTGPLKRLLASDVEIVSDGGGKVVAARNVVRGADRVAAFIFGVARKNRVPEETRLVPAIINGAAGLVVVIAGKVEQTFSFALDASGDIAGIYVIRNPDKLARVRLDQIA